MAIVKQTLAKTPGINYYPPVTIAPPTSNKEIPQLCKTNGILTYGNTHLVSFSQKRDPGEHCY